MVIRSAIVANLRDLGLRCGNIYRHLYIWGGELLPRWSVLI